MKYVILAKNNKTKKWDNIGESETKEVSDFFLIGRINYLNMFENGNYSFDNVKIIKNNKKEN